MIMKLFLKSGTAVSRQAIDDPILANRELMDALAKATIEAADIYPNLIDENRPLTWFENPCLIESDPKARSGFVLYVDDDDEPVAIWFMTGDGKFSVLPESAVSRAIN
jgi:hypothetical protein